MEDKSQEPGVAYNATASDVVNIMEQVRDGISYEEFEEIADGLPLEISDWSRILHISDRTLHRYKKEHRRFEITQSEKILEILFLSRFGAEVLGDMVRFGKWLSLENVALGGVRPLDYLDNSFGIQYIRDVLIRIEHGVLA